MIEYIKNIETDISKYTSYDEYNIFKPNTYKCSLFITTKDDVTYIFYQNEIGDLETPIENG